MTDRPLTFRQQQILNFLRRFVAEHRYAPTLREIGAAVGVSSPSSVAYQIDALEQRGFLEQGEPGTVRSIRLLDTADGTATIRAAEPASTAARTTAHPHADEHIATLEAEIARLRAALAHVAEAADGADWGGPERADVVREWRHAIHQAHQIAGEGNEQ